jgi:hypothetical protein
MPLVVGLRIAAHGPRFYLYRAEPLALPLPRQLSPAIK